MARSLRSWRSRVAGAVLALGLGSAQSMDQAGLEMKSLGTTENINSIVAETFKRAAEPLTADQNALAMKCWKDSVCETGHGDHRYAGDLQSCLGA